MTADEDEVELQPAWADGSAFVADDRPWIEALEGDAELRAAAAAAARECAADGCSALVDARECRGGMCRAHRMAQEEERRRAAAERRADAARIST